MPLPSFHPDFDQECRFCGTSPCVVVEGHPQGETELCGPHFFRNYQMLDWSLWNDQDDDDSQDETTEET